MANEFQPYVGPRPFEKKHKDLFFGRDDEVRELVALITAHREVLLYAQSGAGKTSLINAGLIPSLEKEEFDVLPVVRLRSFGLDQDKGVYRVTNLYIYSALLNWVGDGIDVEHSKDMSLKDFLQTRSSSKRTEELDSFRVVIFDQFEELFTLYPDRWREREGFFTQVGDALKNDPLLRVLFVIREDKLAQMDPFGPLLPEKLRTRFRLELLRNEAARMAIEMPLRHTRRSFEEGAVERLVRELQKIRVPDIKGEMVEVEGEYVEPVQLQVVCQNLWSKLPETMDVITYKSLQLIYGTTDTYSGLSFVDQSLAEFYENAVRKTVTQTQVKEDDLRSWFREKLITYAGTRGIVQDTAGIPARAVEMLADEHLIRAIELRPGVRLWELIHDRLIEPILRSNARYQENMRSEVLNYYWKGTRHADQKQYEEAIQAFSKAIDLDPNYTLSYHERARVYAAPDLKRYEDAIADWNKVIELDLNYSSAYANKGFCLREMGRYPEAIEVLDKAIELDPMDVWSYNEKGRVYYALKEYGKAIDDWHHAVNIDSTYKWAHLNISAALLELKRLGEAVAAADKAIEIDPQYQLAYGNKGSALLGLGRYDEALKALDKAIELDPAYTYAYHERGRIFHESKEYEKALVEYDKTIELDPKYASAYANKGSALLSLGRYDEALKALDKAIELDPAYTYAYHERGRVYHESKDYEKAIAEYDKTIDLDPAYRYAYANKGSALLSLGRYDEALKALDKAIELDPAYTYAYHERGRVYHESKEYEKAIAEYDKTIDLDPAYRYAYANKGSALLSLGRYDEALKALDKAIELDPAYTYAYHERGRVYHESKEYEKAIAEYDKTIDLDPAYRYAYANKALALEMLGRYEEALKAANKALELDSGYVVAWRNKARALAALGRDKDAITCYDKALDLDPGSVGDRNNKASLLEKLERYDEALLCYDEALELDPANVYASYNRGLLYYYNGDYEKAVENWERTIEADSRNIDAYIGKGAALHKLHRYEEAAQVSNKAEDLDPTNVLVLSNKGESLLCLGKTTEAGEALERATAICLEVIGKNPDVSRHYQDIGWLYYLSSRLGEAVDFIKKGLSLSPDLPELYFLLGLTYLAKGSAERSKKAYADGMKSAKSLSDPQAFIKYKDAIEDLDELAFLKPQTKKEAAVIRESLIAAKPRGRYIRS